MTTSKPEPDAPSVALPALLLQALHHFDDAVLVTEARPLDEPGPRILFANPAFTAMTGYEQEDVLGRSCRFLQGPQTDPEARARMRRAFEAQEHVRVELVNYRSDGSPFWVEVLVTPLFDEAGRLTHFASVQRDTTVRKRAQLRLERMALRQELTGLLNRTGFEQELQRALEDRSRPVAVLLADLAGLREVNFSLGRRAGDDLLVEVARRLRGQHQVEAVGQLGGGEFALLVRTDAEPELVALCERLQRVLRAPADADGTPVVPQLSIGVAVSRSADPAEVLHEADVARRASLEEGRDRYALYDPRMGGEAQRRQDLDQGLRRALAVGGELHLHHQPVVGLLDGVPRHAEALLRWERPGVGPVPPSEFIPVAEATGAVLPLSSWVLREACREAAGWQQHLPGVGVSVNLSPKQFASAGVDADVEAALALLPPSLLTLEITEGALLQDPQAAAAQLRRLVERGVRVSLDDFGTGWSSLAYLRHLPVHEIKVDRTFVSGLGTSRADRAIVKAVLGLAADLGADVVAEGVETAEQRDVLAELGCTLAQGWLWSRAVPAATLPAACRRSAQV